VPERLGRPRSGGWVEGERPPMPEPRLCADCGQGPEYIGWRGIHMHVDGYLRGEMWYRRGRCVRCIQAWSCHKMTGVQLAIFLSPGCWIPGCDRVATVVDHDHSICPQGRHSCDQCRRGPMCSSHNRALGQLGDSSSALRAIADRMDALSCSH
jgi:hypothetical protein